MSKTQKGGRKPMVTLFLRTVIFYIILTACMHLMGKRQLGELQMTEFVVAMMLSDMAVIPITDSDIPLLHGIIPLVALSCLEVISAYACLKSPALRRLAEGRPIILLGKGKIDEKNLSRTRVSLDDLFAAVRGNGFRDISEIQYIIMEQSGKISVIPYIASSPLSTADAGKSPEETGIAHAVVLDGRINEDALSAAGRTKEWLTDKIAKSKTALDEIQYMTLDDSGKSRIKEKSK